MKNPIRKNQVIFVQRGKSRVGWISKSTDKRYRIDYKLRPADRKYRQVWRDKSDVEFMLNESNPNVDLKKAIELSKRFHGKDPRRVKRVRIGKLPKAVTSLGRVAAIAYISDKYDGKERVYVHEFDKPPLLLAAPKSGTNNLMLVHGSFRVKAEGIVG